MQINTLTQMIRESGGRFFRVQFIKRTTGELRNMVARLGVQKNIVGTGLKFNPEKHDLMCVFDLTNGYRMINLRTVLEFRCGKLKYVRKNKNLLAL